VTALLEILEGAAQTSQKFFAENEA
jgi:hypothetical protein